jgi:hypothetical protein
MKILIGCKFKLGVMHLRNNSLYKNIRKKGGIICISLVWEVKIMGVECMVFLLVCKEKRRVGDEL